jgi:undecaprenyl-diphosphatase
VAGQGVFLFGITVAVIVAIVVSGRFLREEENRRHSVEWMERQAVLRPIVALGRKVKPQARFLWNRITPGGLGLELTAMLAVLSVTVFIVVGYGSIVTDDPGPTPGDNVAFDVVSNISAGWLTDVAKAITTLGSAGVTLAAALAAGAVLVVKRRWAELSVLVVSMAILYVAVPVMKEGIGRARPGEGLVDVSGEGYPSGHAAYSVLYAWIGLTAAVLWRQGKAKGTGLIVAGVVVAAAIGLSRVYLHVHYFSDVAGGWALGVSAFTICAIVALVVVHLRDNAATVAAGETRT